MAHILTYQQAIDFLYNSLPVFQHQGASAYKPGLERVQGLSKLFGNPEMNLRVIHVAGTNGKGSTAHTLAAVLQSAGYKVGLFTSPHLVDFRERIRIDGQMISQEDVVDFTNRFLDLGYSDEPSFFELTTIMAFEHFARHNVDVALIEVGLGGRLDSTNIVTPILSIITNIALDHTALLGGTRQEIAAEKAGIIKHGVPVVIGESDDEIREVFDQKSAEVSAPLYFASDIEEVSVVKQGSVMEYDSSTYGKIYGELTGTYQKYNTRTILAALKIIEGLEVFEKLDKAAVVNGFAHVVELTGLRGRWMKLHDYPLVICDTAHNPAGWKYVIEQLRQINRTRHIVVGFVSDKDVNGILEMLAGLYGDNKFYFVAPDIKRALQADELARMAADHGLTGGVYGSVAEGYKKALARADKGDMVYVGGSNFVVSEIISLL